MRQIAPARLDPFDRALILPYGQEHVGQHGAVVTEDQGRGVCDPAQVLVVARGPVP